MKTGPKPRREEDLARPRERKSKDAVPVTKGLARATKQPKGDPSWHPIAKQFWKSLSNSGQMDFYQDSDWAYAYSIADDLSWYKSQNKRSAVMLQALNQAMARLLVTEGDRRSVRIELGEEEPDEDPATVAVMDDYRKGLSVVN